MIRLIVADDHVVLREALCEVLAKKPGYQVVAQAADGNELLKRIEEIDADVVIMDLCMPKLDGIEAMKRIKTGQKDIPVLILSANEAERNIRAALKAGAKGFLPKNAAIDELEFALKSIISGKTYLSPSITESIMSASGSSEEENLVKKLTDRELEILKLIAEGISNKQIGKMLHISSRTVDTHRSNILKKLEVKSNQELVKIAISHNLIDL